MLGPSGDINLRVSHDAREGPRHEGACVTRRGDVAVVQHGVAPAPDAPAAAGLGLGEHDEIGIVAPERRDHGLHGRDIDGVRHNGVADGERSAPSGRHPEYHDLMAHELDAAGAACAAGPQVEIGTDGRIGDLDRFHFTQRQSDAEGTRTPRQAHGFQRVGRCGRVPLRLRCADPFGREQRAFHLDEMDIPGVGDARRRHGPPHAIGDLPHLPQSAEVFRRKVGSVGTSNGERGRGAGVVGLGCLENEKMRRHSALGAARHHEADVIRRVADVATEQRLECGHREAAGEVVDAAVPLGLAEDGEDALGRDGAGGDGGGKARNVVGAGRGDAMDLGSGHGVSQANSAPSLRRAQPITRPSMREKMA